MGCGVLENGGFTSFVFFFLTRGREEEVKECERRTARRRLSEESDGGI